MPTPTIYRQGQDIYNANTNQLLTPSAFQPFASNPATVDLGQAPSGQQYNSMYGTWSAPQGPGVTANASNAVPPTPTELAGGTTPEYKSLSDILSSVKPNYSQYTAPDTSKQTAEIEALKKIWDPEVAERNLQSQLSDISNRYRSLSQMLAEEQASQKQADISGLYDVGIVNPLSSGTQSVATFADVRKGKLEQNLMMQKSAEEAAARAVANQQKTEGAKNLLSIAQQQKADIETQAKEQYEANRQMWTDSQTAVQNAFNLYKGGKELTQADKDNAWQGFNNIINLTGSEFFNNKSDDDLENLAGSLGVKTNDLKSMAKWLQKQEILGQKPELRENDGNLYSMEYDSKTGTYTPKLLIKKAPGATGVGAVITESMVEKFNISPALIGQPTSILQSMDYDTWYKEVIPKEVQVQGYNKENEQVKQNYKDYLAGIQLLSTPRKTAGTKQIVKDLIGNNYEVIEDEEGNTTLRIIPINGSVDTSLQGGAKSLLLEGD